VAKEECMQLSRGMRYARCRALFHLSTEKEENDKSVVNYTPYRICSEEVTC
jgi:hypothetical protein